MAVVEGVAVSYKTIQMSTTYGRNLRHTVLIDPDLNHFHETLLLLPARLRADHSSKMEAILTWKTRMKQEM